MSPNRRQQERFSLNLQAKISLRHTGDQPETMETVAANISSSGVYLKTQKSLPLASKVKIEFYLHVSDLKQLKFIVSAEALKRHDSERIWVIAHGVVIRQDENGIGVIFDTNYQITPMQIP